MKLSTAKLPNVVSFLLAVIIVMWLCVASVAGKTLIQPKGNSTSEGYPFAMAVPCPGIPAGISQISIDTREEAAAIAAYVEGRLTIALFLNVMVSADPFWETRRADLARFAEICQPKPSI